MGGDRAPAPLVEGSLQALGDHDDVVVHLVGQPDALSALLPDPVPVRLELVPATEVVGMGEHPGKALRKKPDSSIAVCGRLLAERKVSALVSAGNTGAVIAASMFAARLLPGVHRPGIAVAFPNAIGGTTVLCDVGANINLKPVHYMQYAVMAGVYARRIIGVPKPRTALLNIGTEERKGGSELQAVRGLLEQAGQDGLIDFVGAVEGNDIFEGAADVVVCDGFVGNTILKTAEGVGRILRDKVAQVFAEELGTEQAPAALHRALGRLHTFTDYSTYGGAPLLGIDGCAIIAHGRSGAVAIRNAIRVAREFAQREVYQDIVERLGELATRGVA